MSAAECQAEILDVRRFKREAALTLPAICHEIFATHGESIQVRNEKIAVANLAKIIDATLVISNRKGFAAMSLRDLAERTGLSLGGLYAYIKSKDDLVAMIQAQGQRQLERAMAVRLRGISDPASRLDEAIRSHLYLSEVLLPWFQFLYMEARLLGAVERRQAIAMEQASEKLFADIIADGVKTAAFRNVDTLTTAGMLKALLQDWYLKRGKHKQRGLAVADYAVQVQQLMHYYLSSTSGVTKA